MKKKTLQRLYLSRFNTTLVSLGLQYLLKRLNVTDLKFDEDQL